MHVLIVTLIIGFDRMCCEKLNHYRAPRHAYETEVSSLFYFKT